MSSSRFNTPLDDELPPAHSSLEAADSVNYTGDEQQEISRLAYQFYLDRLGGHGSADEDWVRAEQQVRASRAAARKEEANKIVAVTSVSKTVVGVFDQISDAKLVVSALESAGFSREEISIIAKKDSTSADSSAPDADATEVSASGSHLATDAGIGAALGGVGGLLLSVAGLAIPGIGPVLALGPILAALSGAGLGAVAGGIIGALTGSGVPEEDAHYYAEGVRRGHCLVTVRTDENKAEQVRDIMDQHGALDVEGRVKDWRDRGWSQHRADAEPLSAAELRREREYYSAARRQASEWDREGHQALGMKETVPVPVEAVHRAGAGASSEAASPTTPADSETATPQYGDSTDAAFRKPDRATVKVEQGFNTAMESTVQSARRLGSRIYDSRKS